MPKTFYIMDSFILPTGYNHMFMVQKIAKGFKYLGYYVKVANRISDIKEPGFVMLSDHPIYYSFGSRHNASGNILRLIPGIIQIADRKLKFIKKISTKLQCMAYGKLLKQVKGRGIVIIAWNFADERMDYITKLGMPVIFTGDYYDTRPTSDYKARIYDMYKTRKDSLPLKFAADVWPEEVGQGCVNEKYKVSYVGDKTYGKEWMALFKNDQACHIVPTPPYITEEQKVDIYKNSKIILGVTNAVCKKDGQVPERIFEALAFGSICITDNPYAPKITDGAAIFVDEEDIGELMKLVERFTTDEKARQEQREKGFKFARKKGNWASRMKEFVVLSEKLYGIKH